MINHWRHAATAWFACGRAGSKATKCRFPPPLSQRSEVVMNARAGASSPSFGLPLSLRLALRNLRGGFAGCGIFLACIALGVAAIVGVGSLSHGLTDGLARQG